MSNDVSKFKCKVSTNGKVLGNWINSWADSIEEKVNEAVDEAKTKAKNIATKTLLQAYHTQKYGDFLADQIFISGDYIMAGVGKGIESMYYAEFGAGKVGSKAHPLANKIGWEYDMKEHGDKGWIYPTTALDKNPIKFEKNGRLYGWTISSIPAKFMYKSGQWLEQNIDKILVRKMRSVKK